MSRTIRSVADDPRSHDHSARPAFVAWARPDRVVPFGIAETARRAGHYRWISTQLFETLGSWVASVPEVDVKQRLAVHSHHFAWHAQLWRDRLPELAEMTPAELTVAPNDALRTVVDLVNASESTIERMVGIHRVLLPRLVGAYAFHLARSSELTDGPTVRALRLAHADVLTNWVDGEMLLQSLLRTPADARRAAEQSVRLEVPMVDAGGICGPGSIG